MIGRRRLACMLLAALGPAAAAGAGGAGAGGAGNGPCLVYTEGFDSFAGPADLDAGGVHVAWCTAGATVSSGSFCPTGGALRLASSAQDPVVRVELDGPGCTRATIAVDYSQFAPTGTVLRFGLVDDGALDCTPPVFLVGASLDATGGTCATVTHAVSLTGAGTIYWMLDHQGPSTNAIFIDNVRISLEGCCAGGGEHDCCADGPPGCDDPAVRECVCAADPFCCEIEWDALCVAEVTDLGCGACEGGTSCPTELAEDFGVLYTPGSICAVRPDLFESCEGDGPYLTGGSACGGTGDMTMTFAPGFPYSAAITRCVALAAGAPRLEFTYTKRSGTLGPRVDLSVAGGPFETVWQAPVVFSGGCAPVSIDLGGYASATDVRFRFSSASSTSSGAAIDDIVLAGVVPGDHDCCVTGGPGCDDPVVEACVCAIDPFCCETAWDELCVIGVEYYECGECGLCDEQFATDFGPAFVAGTVCAIDPDRFVQCTGNGPFLSTTGSCGGSGDPALVFAAGAERSAVVTRCLDLAGLAEASLALTYAKLDGLPGPLVEVSTDVGATWEIVWRGSVAPGPGCHASCAELSPYAGEPFVLLRFAAGTSGASGQAFDDLVLRRGAACPAPADLDGDGVVDFGDLLLLLAAWGPCRPPCPADLSGDGAVGFEDVLRLLASWT